MGMPETEFTAGPAPPANSNVQAVIKLEMMPKFHEYGHIGTAEYYRSSSLACNKY
jgi:hypothetical protein